MLFLLPFVDAPGFKITLITTACKVIMPPALPQYRSIIRPNVKPHAIGPASGIINGIGAPARYAGRPNGRLFLPADNRQLCTGFMVLNCVLSERASFIDLRQE
ncbi:sugar transporter [Salmonella enterica subsp. enterica]|nr:sugar transporter [Salmonella enterica subsp. enterica]